MYETPDTPHDASESPYPWAAIVAVAVAASVIGTLFGYLYGYSRGEQAASLAVVEFEAGMTEAEVAAAEPATPAAEEGMTREPPLAAAEPVPPPVVAPAPTGRLVIESEPDGALVTVDGRLEGSTPVTVTDLPFGEHSVQVARPGYTPHAETLTLSEATPARTLSVRLDAGAQAAPVTTGSIVFDSRPPGARVLLDGRLVGTTPLRMPAVAVGEHAVRLELSGYRTVSAQVTVEPGREARLAVTLESGRSQKD